MSVGLVYNARYYPNVTRFIRLGFHRERNKGRVHLVQTSLNVDTNVA